MDCTSVGYWDLRRRGRRLHLPMGRSLAITSNIVCERREADPSGILRGGCAQVLNKATHPPASSVLVGCCAFYSHTSQNNEYPGQAGLHADREAKCPQNWMRPTSNMGSSSQAQASPRIYRPLTMTAWSHTLSWGCPGTKDFWCCWTTRVVLLRASWYSSLAKLERRRLWL